MCLLSLFFSLFLNLMIEVFCILSVVYCSLSGLTLKHPDFISHFCADSNLPVIFEGKPTPLAEITVCLTFNVNKEHFYICVWHNHLLQQPRLFQQAEKPIFIASHSIPHSPFIHSFIVVNLFIHCFVTRLNQFYFIRDKGNILESSVVQYFSP